MDFTPQKAKRKQLGNLWNRRAGGMKNWHKQIKKIDKKGENQRRKLFLLLLCSCNKNSDGSSNKRWTKNRITPTKRIVRENVSHTRKFMHTHTNIEKQNHPHSAVLVCCVYGTTKTSFFLCVWVCGERERELPYVLSDHLLGGFGEVKVDEIWKERHLLCLKIKNFEQQRLFLLWILEDSMDTVYGEDVNRANPMWAFYSGFSLLLFFFRRRVLLHVAV